MNSSDVIDAPNLHSPSWPKGQRWQQEYNAFLRLLPEFLKTHAGKFVAVHNGNVVAVADSLKESALEAYKRVGYVPLHVGLVTEAPPPPLRLPSPVSWRPAASA